jgi:hypothetical protein
VNWIKRAIARYKVKQYIRGRPLEAENIWPYVTVLWSTAKSLDRCAVGPAAKVSLELCVLRHFLRECPSARRLLSDALREKNPLIVGYALTGLKLLGREQEFPPEVFSRAESITVRMGCFSTSRSIGELATILQNPEIH